MKICFPVQKDDGIESAVYNHFGSAPMFAIFDTDTNTITTINNQDQRGTQGLFNPMKALNNQKIDAIIVGGIGAGALAGLNREGLKVYVSQAVTVGENINLFNSRGLRELLPQTRDSHVQGCAH